MTDPVAYRWKYKGSEEWGGVDMKTPTITQNSLFDVEPLYPASALASAMKVKPLEWHECQTHGGRMLIASSLGEQWRIRPAGVGTKEAKRVEAEKAKANWKNEARILATLDMEPSEYVVDLVAPEGWYLAECKHEHTSHRFSDQTVTPSDHPGGAWVVDFQRLHKGGMLTRGRGKNLCEAWQNAVAAVKLIDHRNDVKRSD